MCGLLHCSHLNERLEYGTESASVLSHSFFNVEGKIIPCRTVNVDLGLQDIDPGLVPDGARCGDQKMCVGQRCVPVASVRGEGCPRNCNGNGECNNLAKCHCRPGFAPPHCNYPGPGGSEDGGPLTDPNGSSQLVHSPSFPSVRTVECLLFLFCPFFIARRSTLSWFKWSLCCNFRTSCCFFRSVIHRSYSFTYFWFSISFLFLKKYYRA